MYVCQCARPTVNYDTPRQYLNFNWTDFHIHPRSASSDLQTSTFGKRILPLASIVVDRQSGPVKRLFIFKIISIETGFDHKISNIVPCEQTNSVVC